MFLIQKYRVKEILLMSYLWFLLVTSLTTLLVYNFSLIDKDFLGVFFFSSIFVSTTSLNLKVVLNKLNIKWYNLSLILQPLILLILLYAKGLSLFTIKDFLVTQIASYFILSCFTLLILKNVIFDEKLRFSELKILFKQSFNLGIINQAANLSQIINYRLSFFFIEKFEGLKAVGVFSIVLSIANVIWLFAVSTGSLLGNEISKSGKLTIDNIFLFSKYMKVSVAFTIVAVIVIYILPAKVYVSILNKDFLEVKSLLLMMAPALLIFTIAKIFAYFFSSLGKMKVNLYSSLAGLLPSIILGYFLIKEYKLNGAVISSTISFMMSSIVMLIYFYRYKRSFEKTI